MLVYEEMENDLHRELSRIEKSRHFVCVRTNHVLRMLITRKILRSRDTHCKAEESP